MHYLSGKDLLGLAAPATLIAAVEQALRDYAAARRWMTDRQKEKQ